MPRVHQDAEKPDITLPPNEFASAELTPSSNADEESSNAFSGARKSDKEDGSPDNLLSEKPKPKIEMANNKPPGKIPDSIPTPSDLPAPPSDAIKVFEDEQKAIRSSDSGFFDTEGFPLGDYTNLIVERIKGKWFIPSNLRNSKGNTTVIFYINRDGHFMNARITTSSGSNSLDLAALNAVIESNPFPPLPEGFPGDHVGAKFIFSYNEP